MHTRSSFSESRKRRTARPYRRSSFRSATPASGTKRDSRPNHTAAQGPRSYEPLGSRHIVVIVWASPGVANSPWRRKPTDS
jgi:hypothetical protein